MRFLVDAQLPPLLVRHLTESGHEAEHVADVGLAAARDGEIWDYAFKNGAVLITKDEDFVTMRALNQEGPPIVWIRVGNTTRRALLTRFASSQPQLIDALQRGATVVELSGP